MGVAYEVSPADVDESVRADESPEAYVLRLAVEKARAVHGAASLARAALAADTTVTLDGEIFGKPADRLDGLRMLATLSGRTHRVLTAVALAHEGGVTSALSANEVTFAPLTGQLMERYWETGEPADKAGGYAVQGLAAMFITKIVGSYTGIMGLPVYETASLLTSAGIGHALAPGHA